MEKNREEQQRKRRYMKRAVMPLAAVGMCAAVLFGCGSGRQTEETVVISKTGEPDGAEGKSGTQKLAEGQAMADNVAMQVQIPERYQAEIKEGNILVRVDASIEVPNVPGIKTKKVEARFFTQEDYDTVNEVLFGGGKLWDRDYEAMGATHGFTLAELYEKIESLEAEKANGADGDAPYGDKKETLNQQIASLQEMVSAAEQTGITKDAEKAIIVEIPAVVEKDESDNGDWFRLGGRVTVNGSDYAVDMLNHMDEEWRWIQFNAKKSDGRGDYMPFTSELTGAETEKMQIQPEEILVQAQEALKQMAFSEYSLQGGEYFACFKAGEKTGESAVDKIGYGVHVVRMVDGVPVRYTHQNGSSMKEDESVGWPYEEFTLIYDEEGLVSFYWSDPYEIKDLSAEYVFLLPFSEIQNVFEKMIIKEKQDRFYEGGDSIEVMIDKISLSYMRIREKNAIEGTLVPVWDFFGTQTYKNSNGETIYIQDSDYDSILTINAMDGTVVDREYGY